jgi:hypothetical protein
MMHNEKNPAIDDWLKKLKERIALNDLADRLGLKKQGKNYRSPHHTDKNASVSIKGSGWRDWSSEAGGSTIDLLMFVQGIGFMDAANTLGDWYGIPKPKPEVKLPEKKSTAEYIAAKCLESAKTDSAPLYAYLKDSRKIATGVVAAALKQKSIGWNTYTSPKIASGQYGYGGPAVAFLVRDPQTGQIVAVDLRYQDAEANGNVKTTCQGQKEGHYWTSDAYRLRQAQTVYIVESPINALSVESVPNLPATHAALAIRGVNNIDKIDWRFLRGKRVLIALDHTDPVNPQTGKRPGLMAAWKLSEILTAHDIASHFIDMQSWEEGEDINDVLKNHGAEELGKRLKRLEEWIIPGMPGGGERTQGCNRIWLPAHDYEQYWRFRNKEDFTRFVASWKDSKGDDGETVDRSESLEDLAGFRVASVYRLRVQGHMATINGLADSTPETVFGISCQTARHGNVLQRRVVRDEKLYSMAWWQSNFGAIWEQAKFSRLINIMERAAGLGSRDVANFIGVAWKDGKLAVLEGEECFFVEPEKQSIYNNLIFPRGSQADARKVINAYQSTFKDNAAAIPLAWALGAHLKVILGYWPHFAMQAGKGTGKTAFLERMQNTISFQMLSGQMLKTDHRRRAAAGYTSHPVGFDEVSKLPHNVISDIDALLQNTYRFEFMRVGATMTPHLLCAPVLLAGEEVSFKSLQSKLCRSSLTAERQGPLLPYDLPRFPVYQWLQFIAGYKPEDVIETHRNWADYVKDRSRSGGDDLTARRMIENYAAVLTGWSLLCEFAGLDDTNHGNFQEDLLAEMNGHISATDGIRLPWVWIMEIILSELDARRYSYPFLWEDDLGGEDAILFIRANHVMDHLSTAIHLRGKYDELPIKTGRIFKQQIIEAGVVVHQDVERVRKGKRMTHMIGISMNALKKFGLYANPQVEADYPEP